MKKWKDLNYSKNIINLKKILKNKSNLFLKNVIIEISFIKIR